MELQVRAMAGTLESSDCMITVEPNQDGGIVIEIESIVKTQFGKQIAQVIQNILGEQNVTEAKVTINDKGALDCVIEARLKTAVMRAGGRKDFDWRVSQ